VLFRRLVVIAVVLIARSLAEGAKRGRSIRAVGANPAPVYGLFRWLFSALLSLSPPARTRFVILAGGYFPRGWWLRFCCSCRFCRIAANGLPARRPGGGAVCDW